MKNVFRFSETTRCVYGILTLCKFQSIFYFNEIERTLDAWIFNLRRMTLYIEDSFQYPAGIYLLKVNNRNSRTRCEIC